MSLWCLPPVVLDEVVDAKGTVWQDHNVSKTDVLEVGEVQGKVDDQKTSIATVAAGAGMVLLVLMFLLGMRAGKKKSAIVEIRRV